MTNKRGWMDLILVDTSKSVRQAKQGTARIEYGDYSNLKLSFVDSKGRETLSVSLKPNIEGTQAQVDVLDGAGNSVGHLAAVLK